MPDNDYISPSHPYEYYVPVSWSHKRRALPEVRDKVREAVRLYFTTYTDDEKRQNQILIRAFVDNHVRNAQKIWLSKEKTKQRDILTGRERPSCCDACGMESKIEYDHCHKFGYFRGFLCHRCNITLGYVHDDPILLEILATYLRESQPVHTS